MYMYSIHHPLPYRGYVLVTAWDPCVSLLNPKLINLLKSWNTSRFCSAGRPSAALVLVVELELVVGVSEPLCVGEPSAPNILLLLLLLLPLSAGPPGPVLLTEDDDGSRDTLLPPGLPLICVVIVVVVVVP